MTLRTLQLLLRVHLFMPAVKQMDLHPLFQQPLLFHFVRTNGVAPIRYSPIGSTNMRDRDLTSGDTVDIEDPAIVNIAQRLGVHPAVVCVKWAVQRGQAPIPLSTKRRNYLANLQSTVTEPLTDADMRAIAALDKNCRLIKGQVFLWKENHAWEDLWDLNGESKA